MKIDANAWCEISATVEAKARYLWNSGKLPHNLNLEYDDLVSRCYQKAGYLVNNYEPGLVSLKSYVYAWLDKQVLSSIWQEYNQISGWMYVDLTDNETDEEKHETGEYNPNVYDIKAYTDDRKKQADRDAVNEVYEKANPIDRMIFDMIKEGRTKQEISKTLGLSRPTIDARLSKYR